MQNMLPIKEASRLTGLAQSTLRRLHATGEFVSQMITKGGTRYYSMEQINVLCKYRLVRFGNGDTRTYRGKKC